ncbi:MULTISPECIES: BRO family protein [Acetobacter]|uniref:BRO family protein n=1 Tax=Acetobacter TaxID=434 RepID=UPI00376F7D27
MSANNIVSFSFDGVDVQAVNRNGDVWFVGMEVAKALGYSDTDQAIRKHCKAAENLKPVELTGLGIIAKSPRGLKLIPERDLYRLVMNSEKPDAIAFEEKVVGEILPAIRKTGGYMAVAPEETPEEIMLRALTIAKETVDRQKSQIAELSPKAAALDAISEAEGDMGVRDAGRELGIGMSRVVDFLLDHKWACREGEKKKKLRPAHYGQTQGYCRLVTKTYPERHSGETCVGHDFKITPRGLARLAVLLCGINSEPARRLNGAKKAAPVPFSQTPA